MYWPDTKTGVDVEPARKPVSSAVRKFFTEGGVGQAPTVPGGDWFNQVTNELLNVLAAAGIDPSKVDDDQLLEAIRAIQSSGFALEGTLDEDPEWADVPAYKNGGTGGQMNDQAQAMLNRFAYLEGEQGTEKLGFRQAGAGAVARTSQDKLRERVSVLDWVADIVGSPDYSTKIQECLNHCGSAGKTAYFTAGIYPASGLVASCAVEMEASAEIKYIGPENGTALKITANGTAFGLINVDGNGKNVTPLELAGSNNSLPHVRVRHVIATAAGNTSFCGVKIGGANNNIGVIELSDLVNSGHSNGSFPQAVVVQGAENEIEKIIIRGGRSGLVCSTNVNTNVGTIAAYGMLDNGIYQLTGHLTLGLLIYHGTEEPAVFIGSANVGRIVVRGQAEGLGFQDCGDVTIDSYHVEPDETGATPRYLFRNRAGSANCGRVTFNAITGRFKGSTLFLLYQGVTDFLRIGSMDVTFLYDAAIATTTSSWCNFTGARGFRFTNIHIRIVDLLNTLNGGNVFNMTANPAVTRHSFVHDFDVQLFNSDEITESVASFRGVCFAQQLIETRGVLWRTDIGPYLINSASNSGVDDTANAIPVGGAWKRGKRLYNNVPNSGTFEGWVCVTSGSPGVWKTFGAIAE